MILEYALYAVLGLVVLTFILNLPGVSLLAKPLTVVVNDFTRWLAGSSGSYVVYLFKTFVRSHFIILEHLATREEDHNIEKRIQKEAEGKQ